MNAKTPLFRIENLNAWYDRSHVVQGVSMHVDEGEIVTLMGPQWRWQDHHAAQRHGARRETSGRTSFCRPIDAAGARAPAFSCGPGFRP